MTDVTVPPSTARHMSLPARLVGVIVSPRETYADVAASPRALGVLLVTVLVSTGVTFWFQSTETGQKAVIAQIDQTLDMVEQATGQPAMTDEQYEQVVTAGVSRAPYQSAGTILISTPIVVAILSAILLGVFNGILGGSARYKQVFAAVAHSGVIWTLAAVFGVAVAFAGADLGAASKLAVFVPMLDSGFLYHLLAYIDLFWLWGLTSIAIGMAVLYRRQTVSIAVTFIGVYLLCGLGWAAIRSAIGG